MQTESLAKKAVATALRYLGIRSRSRQEIADYLEKKSFSKEDQNQALEYLDAQGLINDAAFAVQWAHMRLSQGKGDQLIRFELIKKGIDSRTIADIFASIPDEDWFAAINKTLTKKRLSLSGSSYIMQQTAKKTLYQKGFSKHYIDAFLQNEVQ